LRYGCRNQLAGRFPENKAAAVPEGAMLNLPKQLHLTARDAYVAATATYTKSLYE
jgi:hypothetical protein